MAVGTSNPLRQQMINMMYLVLTALLALNVSADILKAFALVHEGLKNTNENYYGKSAVAYQAINDLYAKDKKMNDTLYQRSKIVKQASEELFTYINSLKDDIAQEAGGWSVDKATVEKADDREAGTQLMIHEGKAKELRRLMQQYIKTMQQKVVYERDLAIKNYPKLDLPVNDPQPDKEGVQMAWANYYFEDIPAVAVLTELTKFQNDVRNTESSMLNYLISKSGETFDLVDRYDAVVDAQKPFVLEGEEYQANIYLGAYSSTQQPKIFVDGKQLETENGQATYKVKASGKGEKTIKGYIEVPERSGGVKRIPFSSNYQVFAGKASISADKMNVLYIGLENPISVAVPGFTADKIKVRCSGVELKGTNGKYTVQPKTNSPREVTVEVFAETESGTRKVGQQVYRIRPVPKPSFLFGNKDATADYITRGELATIRYVYVTLGQTFAFEGLNYGVREWTISIYPKTNAGGRLPWSAEVRSSTIPQNVINQLAAAKAGDLIAITGIRANGPYGVGIVPLSNVSWVVQ